MEGPKGLVILVFLLSILSFSNQVKTVTSNSLQKRFPHLIKTTCDMSIEKKRFLLATFKNRIRLEKVNLNKIHVLERNSSADNNGCRPVNMNFLCPMRTVLTKFSNQYPSHMIEKRCTCDQCTSLGSIQNLNLGCQTILEYVEVLFLNKVTCEWTPALRPKVIGCQCTLVRNIELFKK